jgi:hypothetical protein
LPVYLWERKRGGTAEYYGQQNREKFSLHISPKKKGGEKETEKLRRERDRERERPLDCERFPGITMISL